MEDSDQILLSRIRTRDRGAFGAFYDRHSGRIFGLLIQMLRHRPTAEDCLQETFWQVWLRAEQYDPARGEPLAWLILIARSRAIDYVRRQARETVYPEATEQSFIPSPASELERGETVRLAVAALEGLPPEQQKAIRLAFYGGMTYDQIARHENLPLGTIKTRIRLGMQKLRDLFHGELNRDFSHQ